MTGDFDVVGVGEATGGTCWGIYHFAEFASVDAVEIPAIPSAAVRGGFGTAEVYANWFDPGGDPSVIDAVVDGVCTAMELDLGQPGNATFFATLATVADGCHEVWVLAEDAAGNRITYPEIGSLTFGTGCAAEYVVEQMPADCDAAGDDGTSGADDGPADDGCADEAGDTAPMSGAGSSADGSASDSAGGSGSDGADASEDDDPGCACTSEGRRDAVMPMLLVALLA